MWAKLHIFHYACTKRPYFYFLSKIWRYRRVSRPRFPITRGNFGDTWTFKADIAFFIFALIFRTSRPKMAIFRGKIGEGVWRYWPPTNSFFLHLCDTFGENGQRNATVRVTTHVQTDTDRQTQTDFIICPMLYAIAMGQIKIFNYPGNQHKRTKWKDEVNFHSVKVKL